MRLFLNRREERKNAKNNFAYLHANIRMSVTYITKSINILDLEPNEIVFENIVSLLEQPLICNKSRCCEMPSEK